MNKLLIAIIFTLLTAPVVIAQVSISPTSIVIGQDRFGSVTIMNNSDRVQEVSVEFLDQIPGTDEMGNTRITEGSQDLPANMIQDWLRAFPRTFILNPGQRQTVRVVLRPPSNISDALYWKRVKIRSNPQTTAVGTQTESGVSTQINLIFEQTLSTFYRFGNPRMSVSVDNVRSINSETANTAIVYDYNLVGNAPFIGTITYEVVNQSGTVVAQGRSITSMFVNGSRLINLDSVLPNGTYKLRLSYVADRPDMQVAELVEMVPYTEDLQFEVRN